MIAVSPIRPILVKVRNLEIRYWNRCIPKQERMYLGKISILKRMSQTQRILTVIPPNTPIDKVPGIHSNDDKRCDNHEVDYHSDNAYISLGGWINEIGGDTLWWLQRRCSIRIGGWKSHDKKRRELERVRLGEQKKLRRSWSISTDITVAVADVRTQRRKHGKPVQRYAVRLCMTRVLTCRKVLWGQGIPEGMSKLVGYSKIQDTHVCERWYHLPCTARLYV